MNPVSLKFLLFFANLCVVYFAMPRRLRPLCLGVASAGFYLSAGWAGVPYLAFAAAVAYGAGRALGRVGKGRKALFAAAVIAELGVLFALKYFDFFAGLAGRAFGLSLPALGAAAPLGISFYTFMAVGYLTDCYREMLEPEKNVGRFCLFLAFFPLVLQGPIARYGELSPALNAGEGFDAERITRGLWRMLWGYFKKMVIADRMGLMVDRVFADWAALPGWVSAVAVAGYALQLYADFSGFMDIAIGGAQVLGITLPENFDTPYFSRTVPEFWRRWHVTLNTWFRDYLFYPLQRSKPFKKLTKRLKIRSKTAARTLPAILAMLAVWLLTGLWHGAAVHYVAWGVYYGILLSLSLGLEPIIARIRKGMHWQSGHWAAKAFANARTAVILLGGYLLFRAESLSAARGMIGRIFAAPGGGIAPETVGLTAFDIAVLIAGLGLLLLVDILKYNGRDPLGRIVRGPFVLRLALGLALCMAVVLLGMYGPGYDAGSFLYFQF